MPCLSVRAKKNKCRKRKQNEYESEGLVDEPIITTNGVVNTQLVKSTLSVKK